mmetsp:Transcript_52080/g.111530  ORF Transcript_52080/g.111530 Transcript_52080/m.111530 type:complete len:211 (+) Transcript_52080:626-1258(+)
MPAVGVIVPAQLMQRPRPRPRGLLVPLGHRRRPQPPMQARRHLLHPEHVAIQVHRNDARRGNGSQGGPAGHPPGGEIPPTLTSGHDMPEKLLPLGPFNAFRGLHVVGVALWSWAIRCIVVGPRIISSQPSPLHHNAPLLRPKLVLLVYRLHPHRQIPGVRRPRRHHRPHHSRKQRGLATVHVVAPVPIRDQPHGLHQVDKISHQPPGHLW